MKRLILITLLIIMFAPAKIFSQEAQPVPRAAVPAQRNLAQGANIAARARNIDLRASELDEQARNLEMREREIEERARNLDMRERELDEFAENLEMREREMQSPEREMELQRQKDEMAFQRELKELELQKQKNELENNRKSNNKELKQLLFFLILVINILCAVWVYQDIQKRARESGIWIVIALITGLLGTLVYAIVRLGDNAKNKA